MAEHKGNVGKGGIPSEQELLKPLIFPNSQRAFRLFNAALSVGITVYFVFFHKFPQDDHCFMPIRNFVEEQKAQYFRIRPEDEDYITKKTEELRQTRQSERKS